MHHISPAQQKMPRNSMQPSETPFKPTVTGKMRASISPVSAVIHLISGRQNLIRPESRMFLNPDTLVIRPNAGLLMSVTGSPR